MFRKRIAFIYPGMDCIGTFWPEPVYGGHYRWETDALANAFYEIRPYLKIDETDAQRIAFLKDLGRQAGLEGKTVFYPAGGSDAITAFCLNPQADTVIIVNLNNTCYLDDLASSNITADFTNKYRRYFDSRKTYSLMLENFDSYSSLGGTRDYSGTKRNIFLLRDLVRMYLLDGLLLKNIIPVCPPFAASPGLGFKMVYENPTTKNLKNIIYILGDYSAASARTDAINNYVRYQPGLSVILKASVDLFCGSGRGYYNLFQTLFGMPGKILYEPETTLNLKLCHNPRKLPLKEHFGYNDKVNICDLSQLNHPLVAYELPEEREKIKELYPPK